ncbi:MAG: glycosyl transferase family 90 [Bacteroidota bacterium]|nr:glycosyl transferase family 90 [Bacteroidota bacterium]
MKNKIKKILKRSSFKHRNNKALYYIRNFAHQLLPLGTFRSQLENKLSSLAEFDANSIRNRVNYYNKLEMNVNLPDTSATLSDFRLKKKNKTYYFDTCEYTRYFLPGLKMEYKFGDVTEVPVNPSIVKSRPIKGDNANSILLNLDKLRHFTFVNDRKDYIKKKNMLVGRNNATQHHRLKFLEMYIDHPMCNIGKINNDNSHMHLLREFLTIENHLDYKFILCLEGNDVASNLKWVMSSRSLAVMPRPKYETWFMEGTLIPDYHYVLIKDDYSDLQERMEYYISHNTEALKIIENAHQYIDQFRNRKREDLISLLVLEKYFYRTNQKEPGRQLKLLLSPD